LVITNTSLVGVIAGGYSRQDLERIHRQLSELIQDGRLRNAVTATIPFDQLPQGLQGLADNKVIGKLVLDATAARPRPQTGE
jgi:NADPH2:quinone reductase